MMNKKIINNKKTLTSLNPSMFRMFLPLAIALLSSACFLIPIESFAQTGNNVRTTVNDTGNSSNNNAGNNAGQGLLNRNSTLTEKSIRLNATGSCDSTCDAMGSTMAPSAITSSLETRLQACQAGYTGNRTQSRTQNPDGSYTAWVDTDTSLCVCAPTYSDTTQMCASPLGGTYVQRTPWVCNNNVGSLGAPSTVANNCFVPCAPASPSSESTSGACPSGYSGTVYYQRDSSCPSGNGTNSSAAWSGWYTTSSNCVLNQPVYHAGHFPLTLYRFRMGSAWQIINSTGTTMVVTSGEFAGSWAPGQGPGRWNAGGVLPLSNGQTLVVTFTGLTGSEYYVTVY